MIRTRHWEDSGVPRWTKLTAGARFLALVALLWLGTTSSVFAHAVLLSSQPAADSVAGSGPVKLELTFNEPVQVLDLRIIDAGGRNLTPTATVPQAVDGSVSLVLDQPLPDGRYLVSWRVGSLDGHVVGGSFGFAVGTDAGPPPVGVAGDAEAPHWPLLAVHALARVLMLFAAGIALFCLLMKPAPHVDVTLRPLIRWLAVSGAVATLLFLAVDGAVRAGLPVSNLIAPAAWQAATAASPFWPRIVSVAGLLLLMLPLRSGLLLVGAALSLVGMADSGHVLAHLPWGLGQVSMVVHGLAAALWIGAIWPLRQALVYGPGDATTRLFQRFQTYGAIAMGGTLVSGIALAWLLLPRWSDLWQSDYGLRLSAKLALVAAMVGIAAVNRLWLTRKALSDDGHRVPQLRRLLAIDFCVAAGVVILAVGLSLGPPPAKGLKLHLEDDRYAIALALYPGSAGDNRIEIALSPKAEALADPLEVSLRLSAPGIEAVSMKARKVASGRYRIDRAPMWVAGTWNIRIDVLIDSFTKAQLETELILGP